MTNNGQRRKKAMWGIFDAIISAMRLMGNVYCNDAVITAVLRSDMVKPVKSQITPK